jgi:hypothetical protein
MSLSLFALRKNASELLVLRRLRLLARGDLYHAIKDLHEHVKIPPDHASPARDSPTRHGLAVLMYAHAGYKVATSADSNFRQLTAQEPESPDLDRDSFFLDAAWFTTTRPKSLKLDLPLDAAALKWTLGQYQGPARTCARRLGLVGAGTKILTLLALTLTVTVHIPLIT